MGVRRQLSESGRRSILWLAERLRFGYSGEITFICHEGGIRDIKENVRHAPKDLLVPSTGSEDDGEGDPGPTPRVDTEAP